MFMNKSRAHWRIRAGGECGRGGEKWKERRSFFIPEISLNFYARQLIYQLRAVRCWDAFRMSRFN